MCTTRLLRMFAGVGPLPPQDVTHVTLFLTCMRTSEGGRSSVSMHFSFFAVLAEIFSKKIGPVLLVLEPFFPHMQARCMHTHAGKRKSEHCIPQSAVM